MTEPSIGGNQKVKNGSIFGVNQNITESSEIIPENIPKYL